MTQILTAINYIRLYLVLMIVGKDSVVINADFIEGAINFKGKNAMVYNCTVYVQQQEEEKPAYVN